MGTVLETALSAQLKQAHEEIARLEDQIYVLKSSIGNDQQFPPAWGMSPSMRRLLAFLMNSICPTKEQCLSALYWDRPNDEPELKIVDVFVCKIRKKLKRIDETLIIETIWGVGWRMTPATKDKLKTMLDEAGLSLDGAVLAQKTEAA